MILVRQVRQWIPTASFAAIGLIANGCGGSDTASPVVAPPVTPAAELLALEVDPGTLQPTFSSGTTQYTVPLTINTTTVTVTAEPKEAGDTVFIDSEARKTYTVDLSDPGTTKPVTINVERSGATTTTYTVLLQKAAVDGNNSLQSLTLLPGTLVPTFDANSLNYTANVDNNVGSVAVTATLSDSAAAMTVNGEFTPSGQARTVTILGGSQTTSIPIRVAARNGTPKTYTVHVSHVGNTNLSALTVSPGSLSPAFNANTTDYTVNVGSTVTSVTISATKADPNAVLSGGVTAPAGTATGQATIQLNQPGQSTIVSIVVDAPNAFPRSYRITVDRASS